MSIPTRFAIMLVRAYQVSLRPHLIGSCKFCPSCSEYAIEAFERHGLWSGGWLACKRLARCHPFSAGGIDPVPERPKSSSVEDRDASILPAPPDL